MYSATGKVQTGRDHWPSEQSSY